MKSVIDHPRLGRVNISQGGRARRISLSVRPPDMVRLSFPVGVSIDEALSFALSKVEWVDAAKAKLAQCNPLTIIEMPFSTRGHTLSLNPTDTTRISAKIISSTILVSYPATEHYSSDVVQQAIKRGICEALRIEAKEYLPSRVAEMATALGLKHGRVTVRDSRSRWGSCSSSNDISLSIHLMRLPNELIDYILVHELCHTRIKNHGPKFHELLDRLSHGRHKELRLKLKDYSTRL